MRQLVVRLTLATAVAAVAAVTAATLVLHALTERSRLRTEAEGDLSALVSLVEISDDEEALLRGLARTAAGREGRLAVHLPDTTVGTSRWERSDRPLPAETDVAGGTVLLRRVGAGAGPAVVEAFVPARGAGSSGQDWMALLLGAGALVAGTTAVTAARRLRPALDDLGALTATTRGIGSEDRPRAPATHAPETAAMAAALATLADRFEEARVRERRLAADLSHRLRTPLTALALDTSVIGDGAAEERVRQMVTSLNTDIDTLIRAAPSEHDRTVRCDVAAVVHRRMAFWSALAQHAGRPCEFRSVDSPAVTALAEDDLAAVIDALLGNIFRCTAPGTAFAVSVVRHAGWITLVVDDAGPGVADPVSALSRGVSSSGSTGLGLDIARDAVEATGGTIHIERAALGGARIRLRFGEAGTRHADAHEPRAWRLLWGSAGRPR